MFPIGLYLRVGLDGIGWDSYEECFWEHALLRFEYAYIGLPALNAGEYVEGDYLIGAALSSLMRLPAERRVELHLEALKRIADSDEDDYRRSLLAECLEAYSKLDEAERQRLETLLDTPTYQKVKPLMITTFERGKIEGKLEGKIEGKLEGKMEGKLEGKMEGRLEGKMEGRLELMLELLEAKFGPLPPEVVQRVVAMDAEQLRICLWRCSRPNL